MDTAVTQTSLLEVRACKQAYHKEANTDLVVLEDVNLSLREGEIVGLLGRSGSGKSDQRLCRMSGIITMRTQIRQRALLRPALLVAIALA